jgi:hypothetical protein
MYELYFWHKEKAVLRSEILRKMYLVGDRGLVVAAD